MVYRRSMLALGWLGGWIFVSLCLSQAMPGISFADEMPGNAQTSTPPDDKGEMTTITQAVVEAHDRIERDILEQVIRFDDFFGSVKAESEKRTEYQLRWRNSLRVDNTGHFRYGTSLWASLSLSKTSDRLKLVIAGEDEPQPLSPNIPQDPGNPGYDRTLTPSTRLVNTELRFGLIKTPSVDLFVGGGFRIRIPPEFFVRSRFQFTQKIDDSSLARLAETVFVNNNIGLGETTELSLERLLGWGVLGRWANAATLSEKISGLEWGSELSFLRELSSKSAITIGSGVYGNSAAVPVLTNYRVFTRYRRNVLVSWLYYELEPEVFWPRDAVGAFVSHYAFTVRLEVMFRGAAAGN